MSAEERGGEPIPLSRPWIDDGERARVAQALAGRLAGDGPIGRGVEHRLQEMTGARRVLLTTSCTHALELALLALGVGPGDEVVCPSFTFVSTANAALRVGARPVFADIEEETLGLDPDDVARRIGPRTRAIIPVHYAGLPGRLDPLLALARTHGLRVVEDAAQAFDARWRGQALGTLGDAGCLSFHETKNVTCGEGGALLINDAELAERAEIAREKGTNRSRFLRGEVDKYTWVAEGSSYILSDVLAALLDAQLDKVPAIRERRAHVAALYRQELAGWAAARGIRLPAQPADTEPNHHIFFLLLPDVVARDRVLEGLRAQAIGAAFHYVPLHSSPFGRTLAGDLELPATDRVADGLVRLPLYPQLRDDQVRRVCDAVRESVSSDAPRLSVVVACYNEEEILLDSFRELKDTLDHFDHPYEILFVDDRSRDRTVPLIEQIVAENPGTDITVIRHEVNQGRGATVTDGFRAARGEITGYLDIDLEVHARYIPSLVRAIERGADVATVQRIYAFQLRALDRYILSRGYSWLVGRALRTAVKDTETGYKFFRREALLPVLGEIQDGGWFWDTEFMLRAERRGLRIAEIPGAYVRRYDKTSTVHGLRDSVVYFRRLLAFRRQLERRP